MSDPLAKFIETSKLCGWILISTCLLSLMILLAAPNDAFRRSDQIHFAVGIVIGHGVPGVLYFPLVSLMWRRKYWAFIATFLLTAICFLKACFGMIALTSGGVGTEMYVMAAPCCAPIQGAFLAYVAARCIMAWPDIQDLRADQRRARAMAAHPPAASGPVLVAPPPPSKRHPAVTGPRR